MEVAEQTTAIVKVDPKEFGLDENKAAQIEQAFAAVNSEREALTAMYAEIIVKEITPELIKEAGELRKKLVKVRTGTDRVHKSEKAFSLAYGRFVDAWKNKSNTPVELMEEKLSEIENYYINLEKKRIAQLQLDRIEAVKPYGVENAEQLNLGVMSDEVWHSFLTGTRTNHEAKIEAARKAEQERIEREQAEAAERKRIADENESLKKEAEVKKAEEKAAEQIKINRHAVRVNELKSLGFKEAGNDMSLAGVWSTYWEQIRNMDDDTWPKYIEDIKIAIEKNRLSKIKLKEQSEKLAKEKAEKEKLEAELKAKADAELKAKQEAEAKERERVAAEKKAAKAPKKQKLNTWIDGFVMGTPAGLNDDETVVSILEKFEAFKKWAKVQIENL